MPRTMPVYCLHSAIYNGRSFRRQFLSIVVRRVYIYIHIYIYRWIETTKEQGEGSEGMDLSGESFRIIYQVCLIDRPKRNVLVYAALVFYRASSSRFNPSSYRYFTSYLLFCRFRDGTRIPGLIKKVRWRGLGTGLIELNF